MTHATKIGIGLVTGMFYHAPAGTSLPETPSETLGSAWTLVGDVTEDGITLSTSRDTTPIKNWARQIKREIQTSHEETIQAPIQDTTEESLKTVLGEDNVNVTAATATHGKIVRANLSAEDLPPEEAYLFLMKDDDDLIAIGCETGQITSVENVTFAPNAEIKWTPTIKAVSGFVMIMDDGQTV